MGRLTSRLFGIFVITFIFSGWVGLTICFMNLACVIPSHLPPLGVFAGISVILIYSIVSIACLYIIGFVANMIMLTYCVSKREMARNEALGLCRVSGRPIPPCPDSRPIPPLIFPALEPRAANAVFEEISEKWHIAEKNNEMERGI